MIENVFHINGITEASQATSQFNMDDQVIIETTFFSIENILFEIFKMFFPQIWVRKLIFFGLGFNCYLKEKEKKTDFPYYGKPLLKLNEMVYPKKTNLNEKGNKYSFIHNSDFCIFKEH